MKSIARAYNPVSTLDLRGEVDRLLQKTQWAAAAARLGELWRADSSSATAAFVVSRFEKLRGPIAMLSFRLAILRSFTVEPIVPLLRAEAFCFGIDLSVHIGDFNAYAQEILDSESSLYRFAPNAMILAVQTGDIAPDLERDYAQLSEQAAKKAAQRVFDCVQQYMREFRRCSQAALIVHNLEQPMHLAFGVLDSQRQQNQTEAVRQINRDLVGTAGQMRGVYVLDYDELVARHGRFRWHDERMWLTARLPIAAEQMVHLAREWMRFLVPLTGKTAKALVVDLDNTLWGGVIGEDGMSGIKLSAEYPGAAYQALQRAMLDLTHKGILLAICSKNNPEDAIEVLEKHPGMLLRTKHFAAMRISWNDKSQGLREIASELNIGIDSLAFADDNPLEREQVRSAVPEAIVIDLPQNPLEYAAVIRDHPAFERLTLSGEDRQRTTFYAAQRERAQSEQTFRSKEDFYRFLEQEAEIATLTPTTLPRISQLTQKTNQFNVTTRRYAEQQISEMAANPSCQVLSIRVRDRFGDHGLVGVSITRDEAETCEIDTFLLSCRVIGRTVETALLAHLADQAGARGRKRLVGWFLPTRKNAPARDFYKQHGFDIARQNGDGALWVLDLTKQRITCPEWVTVVTVTGGND